MDLDQLLDRHTLTAINILERVDEFTLYCRYLGYIPEIGLKHRSPIRVKGDTDDYSSFGIFPATRVKDREFMWKDHGKGISGDIFRLIKEIFGYTNDQQVYQKIDKDFNLGLSNGKISTGIRIVEEVQPLEYYKADIRIDIREKWYPSEVLYWKDYTDANKSLLNEYEIFTPSRYWTAQTQIDPYIPIAMCFAYHIKGKYKIYRPKEPKDRRFRNNLTDQHIEGFYQLKYNSDLIIITKSMKDVICLRGYGYEAIAARSENTLLIPEALTYLERHYKHILVLFDNDGKHKADEYPYDKIFIPEHTGTKDTSDYHFKYGHDQTGQLLYNLIGR